MLRWCDLEMGVFLQPAGVKFLKVGGSNMIETKITVYGAHWCPDCKRAKKFLGEQFVPYQWVDIEKDPQGESFVLKINNGKRIIPTIVFEDGSFLVEPSNAELARKLGLQTEARFDYYDLIIIGGGPTGLTAAIYAAREGVNTLLIERSALGGQAGITAGIENFPGFPEGVTGQEFADRITKQARRYDVEILQAQEIFKVCEHGNSRCVLDGSGKHYHANAVLMATGATYKRLDVPGEEDLIGAGIHFCATCDGPFYKGAKELVVIGGGNSAAEEGLNLTRFAEKVTMLVRGGELTASRFLIDKVTKPGSQIDIRFHASVQAFEGQAGKLSAVQVKNTYTGDHYALHPAAAFVFIGLKPNIEPVADQVALDASGYVLTGHDLMHFPGQKEMLPFETSLPGVFAAGDVRHGSTKQIASAVGEGAAAALSIREYLKQV
jgi:thioredoxin reductase (NADPH)